MPLEGVESSLEETRLSQGISQEKRWTKSTVVDCSKFSGRKFGKFSSIIPRFYIVF